MRERGREIGEEVCRDLERCFNPPDLRIHKNSGELGKEKCRDLMFLNPPNSEINKNSRERDGKISESPDLSPPLNGNNLHRAIRTKKMQRISTHLRHSEEQKSVASFVVPRNFST